MSTALVVSRFFPFNSTRIHAVYQRLGTQVRALAQVTDIVHCLFLVPPDQARTPTQLAEHQRQLQALWAPNLEIELAPVVEERPPDNAWDRYVRGIVDFSSHPIARPVRNPGAIAAVTRALARNPALVLAHRLSAMCLLLGRQPIPPTTFFDLDDVEHLAFARRLLRDPDWPMERLLLLQTPRVLLAELEAMRRSVATFVCSEADRRLLRRWAPTSPIEVVPNSVAFPDTVSSGADTERLVLFVGSMGSRPNAQAVDFLVQQVWPRVAAKAPDARLAIVGNGAELTQSHRAPPPGVSFLGFVDDLAGWYARARAVCCPILHGSGTRVKIIEAAANGKAIVSTRMGAEGLDFERGREIVIAEGAAALADATCGLLDDPMRAEKLGTAARARARVRYERDAVAALLVRIFRDALGQLGPAGGTDS